MIDEIIRPNYLEFFHELDRSTAHPVDKLQEHLQFLAAKATNEDVALGCPLNNLVQEMSPIDEDFRLRMKSIVDTIHRSIASALRRGQASGRAQGALRWAGVAVLPRDRSGRRDHPRDHRR